MASVRNMIFSPTLTHVGTTAAMTVTVGSALHDGLTNLNFYQLPAAIWFCLLIVKMFADYLSTRKLARGPIGHTGPEGPAGTTSPELSSKLDAIVTQNKETHDLVNGASELLKKLAFEAGRQAERENPSPPPPPHNAIPR